MSKHADVLQHLRSQAFVDLDPDEAAALDAAISLMRMCALPTWACDDLSVTGFGVSPEDFPSGIEMRD